MFDVLNSGRNHRRVSASFRRFRNGMSRRFGLAVALAVRLPKGMTKISYNGYRFPPEIIQQAIWLYFRFTLSFRDVGVGH